jgi:hypothetical protein
MDFNDPLILSLVILVAIFILGAWVFPYYMIKNAVPKVVEIFQRHGAISEETARWPHEMGLGVPTMTRRIFRTRDYKPQALDVLIRAALLAVCDDGKLFLVEANLMKSSLYNVSKDKLPTDYSDKGPKMPRF